MSQIKLSEISTLPPEGVKKKKIEPLTQRMAARIGELQMKLYAERKQSLLVVLQGMDASGKDGIIKHVMGECNPEGFRVSGFKKPTELEMRHDFLWRVHSQVPAKGEVVIFNRSHYEDILIQSVHNWITPEQVAKRMQAINDFENLLQFDNQTTVLKFYLHISNERQGGKLQERIENPLKNWKHNAGDWEERKLWEEYMQAYEYALNNSAIPWHVIPCDKRYYRNYCAAEIVLKALENMDPQLPVLNE